MILRIFATESIALNQNHGRQLASIAKHASLAYAVWRHLPIGGTWSAFHQDKRTTILERPIDIVNKGSSRTLPYIDPLWMMPERIIVPRNDIDLFSEHMVI